MNELQKYQGFKAELAIVETFEEIKLIESKAAVAAEFAKRNKIGLSEQNEWGKFRVEIEDKKGEWLDQFFPHGVGLKKGAKIPERNLGKMPVPPKESANARLVHNEPELKEKAINNIIGSGKVITPSLVNTEIRKEKEKEARKELAEIGSKKEISVDFRLGDFEKVLKNIPDNSVDCIITDPPYSFEFIECWSKLSKFAKRVLKSNGFCIAYSGHMYLPEVLKRMNENLDYYWIFAVYHAGQTQIVSAVNLICRWKPVLVFQKGKKKLSNTFQDYFISEKREKDGHEWQQGKSGVSYLIEMFTKPGDLIIDPFAGSGTTIIAARELSRTIIAAEINEETYNIAKSKL